MKFNNELLLAISSVASVVSGAIGDKCGGWEDKTSKVCDAGSICRVAAFGIKSVCHPIAIIGGACNTFSNQDYPTLCGPNAICKNDSKWRNMLKAVPGICVETYSKERARCGYSIVPGYFAESDYKKCELGTQCLEILGISRCISSVIFDAKPASLTPRVMEPTVSSTDAAPASNRPKEPTVSED